jgi:2-keto-4-pentenoate hydratase/2-oxohepta-3-ene-1,7-dioic acid hydratase in catechol pathway
LAQIWAQPKAEGEEKTLKILRFNDDRIGVLKNENSVVDVSEAITSRKARGPQGVVEEIIGNFRRYRRRFEKILERKEGVPLDSVKLLVPIPRPSKCLAAFVNYLDRPDRTVESLPREFFFKAPELLGPEGTVELLDIPPVAVYQPEAELAFVIGKRAKNVPEQKAMDYVLGYAPFFDISARGMNRRTQFVPKGQDTYGPCGPWITTKDEIPDPHDLRVQSWVNGQARQDYSTKYMAHKIPAQIAWLSRFIQLQPGDIVATGTYHEGLGPINDGDVLEIEIERLGRSKFFVKGRGPRKDTQWMPGVSQPPAGGMTVV